MNDRISVPSLELVERAPLALEGVVTADGIDENGHLNVRGYFDWHMRASDEYFETLGLTEDYRRDARRSVFSLSHQIIYLAEVVEGEQVSVHVQLTDCTEKIARGWSAIVNRSGPVLCNVLHFVEASVGLDSRRIEPFAEPLLSSVLAAADPPTVGGSITPGTA